jgi:NADP-dependent 3-hydroxy acid dehydrogenase YdfG
MGRAMVDEFARLGHVVLGCARSRDSIDDLRRRFSTHNFQVVNIAEDKEVELWANQLIIKYGPPDFIINSAAYFEFKAPLWQMDSDEFGRYVNTNIEGAVNVVRHFLPSMINRRRGFVVNFTSRWGRSVEERLGPYCATKWAIDAITLTLAKELRSTGVAAIGLNPGRVKTAMLLKYLGNTKSLDSRDYPTPEEWAAVAVPFILKLSQKDSGRIRKINFKRPIVKCSTENSLLEI